MTASQEDRLPEDELIGQMSCVLPPRPPYNPLITTPFDDHRLVHRTFILAAMDTTSTALATALQLLSEHPEVQQKLRQDILDASRDQDLDYDALVSLPYLDAVCRETLRLYVDCCTAHSLMVVANPIFPRSHPPVTSVFRE